MHSCLLGKNAFFHKLLVVAMFETFVPRGDFIWVPRTKIILRQLSGINNTEMACCENSEAICILAHLWLGFGLPWERSRGGGSAEFSPSITSACVLLRFK